MAIASSTSVSIPQTTPSIPTTSAASSAAAMSPTATHLPAAPAHRISPTSYLSKVFSLVDHPASGLRFLVLDCPSDSTLPSVLKVFAANHVTDVVRVCEPTYATTLLAAANIRVHDLPFQDGGVPSPQLIVKFMAVVNQAVAATRTAAAAARPQEEASPCTIAVHCIAGLGRAPLMVAIALIEYGMPPLDAITYIRARRRGAFNTAQVKWIDAYKPQGLAHGVVGGTTASKRLGGSVGGLRRSRSVESSASAWGGGFMGSMWRKMMSSLSMGRRKSHPGAPAAPAASAANA